MTNILVATTLHALGSFDERHQLALNIIGMNGYATPNCMIQKVDLVLALGCRFGSVFKVTEFVHSDCKTFLRALNKHNLIYKNRLDWLHQVQKYQNKYPQKIPTFQDGSLSVQRVISQLNVQVAPYRENCVFTTGVGVHQMVAAQLLTWTRPKSIITSGGLGTMGVTLGFAIGAKLADKSKTVIAIDGDGSFNMTFTELQTIMNLALPIKIIIMNNESEMMVTFAQTVLYDDRRIATEYQNCDYNKLADEFNIHNLYCDNESNLMDKDFSEFAGAVLFYVNIHVCRGFLLEMQLVL